MSAGKDHTDPKKPAGGAGEAASDAENGGEAGKGLFGKFNARFQEALQQSRGDEAIQEAPRVTMQQPAAAPIDDVAMKRAKNVARERMVVPDGVEIEGSINSRSETAIGGKIKGDVVVESALLLAPTAVVTGDVRTHRCAVNGTVEGNIECNADLEIGQSGRINGDAVCGKNMVLGGQVMGNVTCVGMLRLASTATVTGNLKARSMVIEDGAVFNGKCTMGGSPSKPAPNPSEQHAESLK